MITTVIADGKKEYDFIAVSYTHLECLTACKKALDTGGTATAVVNGANEEANALFRQGKPVQHRGL